MARDAENQWLLKAGDYTFSLYTVDDSGAKVAALSFTRSSRDKHDRPVVKPAVEGEVGG